MFTVRDMSLLEPLGVMYLSAAAKQLGHESLLAVVKEEDVLKKIEDERPDMLCISALSVDASVFRELTRRVKDKFPELFTVVGGPHATFEVDDCCSWAVDAVIQGEGDLPFVDLLKAVDAGEPYDNILNLHTKDKRNDLRPLVRDLDSLPHPDRSLVYFSGGHLKQMNVKSFMAGRGCAFKCTYCFNSKYNEMYRGRGKIIRKASVDYIIEEIEEVKRDYDLSFVRFGDDGFVNKVDDWLLEFADKYPKKIGLPFYCLVRPNCLNRDVVSLLRSAGCHSMCISIEAGNEKLRNEVLGRNMKDEIILNAYNNLHEAGINVYSNAMVGLPGSTIEDELKSVELFSICKPVYPSFTVFTPFKGTALGDRCEREGLIDGEYPEHTTDRSILNCFSDKQKDIQINIAHLGPCAAKYPFLKRLILKHLIYWKPNIVFFLISYLQKNYLGAKYIWPIKAGIFYKLRMALRALSFELPSNVFKKSRGKNS